MIRHLHIGPGRKTRGSDYVLDVRSPSEIPGVRSYRTWTCGVATALPFKSGVFDSVTARHVIEHVGWRQTASTLAEWFRVLKIAGRFEIVCPNLESYCRRLPGLSAKTQQHLIEHLWGDQDYPANFHLFGFTPGTLSLAVRRACPKADLRVVLLPIYAVTDAQIKVVGVKR